MANYRNSRDDKSEKKSPSSKPTSRKPSTRKSDDGLKTTKSPYNKTIGEGPKKFSSDSRSDKKPYSSSKEGGYGDKKPFSAKKEERFSDKKPFSANKESRFGDKKPFSANKDDRFGDKKPYSTNKEGRFGDKKPFSANKDDRFGDKKPHSFSKDDRSDDKKAPRKRTNTVGKPERGENSESTFKKKNFDKTARPEGGKSFSKSFSKDRERPVKSFDDADTFEQIQSEDGRKSNKNENYSRPFTRNRPTEGRINKGGKGPAKPRDTSVGINPKKAGEIRLNKYLSNAGVASRRKADELIIAGEVMVNDVVVTEMGYKVMPGDKVRFNGQVLKREKNVYILLNKPKDYITTTDDPQERKTVMELVKNATKERIYPVGRLDRNTTGLLLLTNDGELAMKLAHPKNNITKLYHVFLDKNLKKVDFDKIEKGIELEDGLVKVDHLSYVEGAGKDEIGIELHSGKNRIVRRIFESLGYQVVKLDRSIYAGLTKKDLARGKWRHLNDEEVVRLKHFKA